MKIQYKVGDLLQTDSKFIAQGCNAQGDMGGGISRPMMIKFPEQYEQYVARHARTPLKVGEVLVSDCGTHVILNCISQEFFGNDGSLYFSYEGFYECVKQINYIIDDLYDGMKGVPVSLPLIGAGLAGGNWDEIATILEKTSIFQPIVYVLDASLLPKK